MPSINQPLSEQAFLETTSGLAVTRQSIDSLPGRYLSPRGVRHRAHNQRHHSRTARPPRFDFVSAIADTQGSSMAVKIQ